LAGATLLGIAGFSLGETVSTGRVRLDYRSCQPNRMARVIAGGVNQGVVLAGQYNLQLDPTYDGNGDGLPGVGEGTVLYAAFQGDGYRVGTFCADVYQRVPRGFEVYDVYHPADAPIGGANPLGGIGPAKATQLRQLFYYVLLGNETQLATPYDRYSADHAAAFQAAVWEIIHEDSSEPATYTARSGSGLRMEEYRSYGWLDLTDDWLGWLSAPGWEDPELGLRVLANADRQDYALTVPPLGSGSVPEPLTLAGALAGVAAVGAYVRRRKRCCG